MKQEEHPSKKSPPGRSFTVALEQMAQILRSEVKLKDRDTIVLSSKSPSSINNLILQVARLLRTQLHTPTLRKRSWKQAPPPSNTLS